MDKYAAVLELMTPEEVGDALWFVDVMERPAPIDAEEADEWRRRIGARSRFRLRRKAVRPVVGPLLEDPDPFVPWLVI